MSKVYTYMMISIGLVFLLKFGGIPTGADTLISYLGISGDASRINLSTFFIAIAGLFTIGAATGIAVGFLTKSPTETYLVSGICLGIFTIITSTFVSVINYTKGMGYVYYLVWLIFVPLIISFGIAIIQFWRGID